MHQKQVPHFCAKCLPWSLRTSLWTHSDVPVRWNVPLFPRGPMSSTEASSDPVIHMQLKSRLGTEVCALAKKCHVLWWFICRCGPKTAGQVHCPSTGGGESLTRSQPGRAYAQPSSKLSATKSAWNAPKKPHECAFETDWLGMTFSQGKSGQGYQVICSEEPQEDSSITS